MPAGGIQIRPSRGQEKRPFGLVDVALLADAVVPRDERREEPDWGGDEDQHRTDDEEQVPLRFRHRTGVIRDPELQHVAAAQQQRRSGDEGAKEGSDGGARGTITTGNEPAPRRGRSIGYVTLEHAHSSLTVRSDGGAWQTTGRRVGQASARPSATMMHAKGGIKCLSQNSRSAVGHRAEPSGIGRFCEGTLNVRTERRRTRGLRTRRVPFREVRGAPLIRASPWKTDPSKGGRSGDASLVDGLQAELVAVFPQDLCLLGPGRVEEQLGAELALPRCRRR